MTLWSCVGGLLRMASHQTLEYLELEEQAQDKPSLLPYQGFAVEGKGELE